MTKGADRCQGRRLKPPSRCYKKGVHILHLEGERIVFCDDCFNRAVRGGRKGVVSTPPGGYKAP